MPVIPSGTLIQPSGYNTQDLENAKFTVTNGTVSLNTNTSIGTVNANPASGTITQIGTILGIGGTVQVSGASAGTNINMVTGTINSGTFREDGRPTQNILTYGTTFGSSASGYGTIVGSASVGAGTYIWINDLSIVNSGGGTLLAMVGFGTALNGTSVLAKGSYPAQGGIQKSYPGPVNAGMTNQDLVCYVGAAGTIDVNVSYFISA